MGNNNFLTDLRMVQKALDNTGIGEMRKAIKSQQSLIQATKSKETRTSPALMQWADYKKGLLSKTITSLTNVQLTTLKSTKRVLPGLIEFNNLINFNIPQKISFFTDYQMEMINWARKGLNTGIPNIPKDFSFFSLKEQEMLKSIGSSLNLGLNKLPKSNLLFTREQQELIKSATKGIKGLNIEINSLSKASSFFTPLQREMLKSLSIGLNSKKVSSVSENSILTIDDYAPYWEDEKVQEIIEQELSNMDDIQDTESLINRIGNWLKIAARYHNDFRENSPFVYMIILATLCIIGSVVFNITILPSPQDMIKDKVWDYINNPEKEPEKEPKKQAKKLKSDVLMECSEIDYAEAQKAINFIRIINRETEVYRSDKRKSGSIDTLKKSTVVIIVQKKKNWSLVIYLNNYEEEVSGWVSTKNLTR